MRLARNYLVKQGQHIEKAPKDGEGRVLSLDLLTCELFQEWFQHRRAERGQSAHVVGRGRAMDARRLPSTAAKLLNP